MQRQGSFSQAEYAGKKKQTRRDKFLAEMEQVVPWVQLVTRLRPFYPKGERGRPPVGLERMLRIYLYEEFGVKQDMLLGSVTVQLLRPGLVTLAASRGETVRTGRRPPP